MVRILEQALTFDDVLIVPQHSRVNSRSDVDISTFIGLHKFSLPVISSNMDTITGPSMAKKMAELGGLGVIHRYMSVEDNIKILQEWNFNYKVGVSVGILERDEDRINAILGYFDSNDKCADSLTVCVDIAHGDSKHMVRTIEYIRSNAPKINIIAGAVCTPDGVENLMNAGANIVRVGIGAGCFAAGTRILMSNGLYKDIQDVKIHDKVINMNGKVVEVIGTKFSGYKNVKRYKNVKFHADSYATSDHQHWVGDYSSIKNIQDHSIRKVLDQLDFKGISKYKWKRLDECEKAAFLMPKEIEFELPKTFEINLSDYALSRRNFKTFAEFKSVGPSYELGYIFGTYLGDGHARLTKTDRVVSGKSRRNTSGSTTWYFGLEEYDIANKLARCLLHLFEIEAKISKEASVITVTATCNPLSRLLISFGKKDKKHLPSEFLSSNIDYINGLLDGLVDSDGHVSDNNKDGRTGFTNTSTTLIEQYGLFHKIIHGYYPSVLVKKPTAGQLKNCNIDNCKASFLSKSLKNPDWEITNDYQICKVYSVDNTEIVLPTYDIEVDCDTHSFIANNVIVHNSVCKTRTKTGCGYPQLSAIIECATAGPIIADGGISGGDSAAKALAAGSQAIMIGGMLSGTDCVPHWNENSTELEFRGMASNAARLAFTGEAKHEEGISCLVPAKPLGSTEAVISQLCEGITSAMSYSNSLTLHEFHSRAVFVKTTHSIVGENIPHMLSRLKG